MNTDTSADARATISKLLAVFAANVAYTDKVAVAAERVVQTPNAVSVDLYFDNYDRIDKITVPVSRAGDMVAYWKSLCEMQADLIRTNTAQYVLARAITNEDRDAIVGALPERANGASPIVNFAPGSLTVKADIPVSVRPVIDMGGDKVIEYDHAGKPIGIRRAS